MDDRIKDVEKIRIFSVTGGDQKDQDDLLNCYFEQLGNPGDYILRNQNDQPIWTSPSLLHGDTRRFRFIYGGYLWTVTNFQIDFSMPLTTAQGNWHNDHNTPEQDDGEFHAQSGGRVEEESASYANA